MGGLWVGRWAADWVCEEAGEKVAVKGRSQAAWRDLDGAGKKAVRSGVDLAVLKVDEKVDRSVAWLGSRMVVGTALKLDVWERKRAAKKGIA
jgi:hypothetical protein